MNEFLDQNYIKNDELLQIYKHYLSQFDNISVRETSGVEILKNDFEISSTLVLDPVFLLSKEHYIKNIVSNSFINDKNCYMFKYFFSPTENEDKIINKVAIDRNLNIIHTNIEVTSPIEDWVAKIYNSKLFITNSFHGLCFAIIFNKDFICIANKNIGNARMKSTLELFGLEKYLVQSVNEITTRPDLFDPIDWEKVNSILEREKERSLKWLKDALEAPKDFSKVDPADAIIQNLNNKILALQSNMSNQLSAEGVSNLLDYNKNYRRYIKYKIFKNFVFGSTRERYKKKQKIYHEKIRSARRIKRGIAGV